MILLLKVILCKISSTVSVMKARRWSPKKWAMSRLHYSCRTPCTPRPPEPKSLHLSWWKGELRRHGAVVHCRRLCNNQRDSLAVLCSCHLAQWRERCQDGGSISQLLLCFKCTFLEGRGVTGLKQTVLFQLYNKISPCIQNVILVVLYNLYTNVPIS